MTELTTAPKKDGPGQPAALPADRMRYVLPALLSTLITMVALAPVLYAMSRSMPPRVVTVDLQGLVDEEQKRTLAVIGNGGVVADEQRMTAERLTVEFAKQLSGAVDALAEECRCVIVNKAALLGGETVDYTDQVRARVK